MAQHTLDVSARILRLTKQRLRTRESGPVWRIDILSRISGYSEQPAPICEP